MFIKLFKQFESYRQDREKHLSRYVPITDKDQIEDILNELRDDGCDVIYKFYWDGEFETSHINDCDWIRIIKPRSMSNEDFENLTDQVGDRLVNTGCFKKSESLFHEYDGKSALADLVFDEILICKYWRVTKSNRLNE